MWHKPYVNKTTSFTLFKTLLTSLANSLEHTSKWKIFPQFETQAPRSCEHVSRNASLATTGLVTAYVERKLIKGTWHHPSTQRSDCSAYCQSLHSHMGVLVVHPSHDRAETFFRPGAALYSSKKSKKEEAKMNSSSIHMFCFVFFKDGEPTQSVTAQSYHICPGWGPSPRPCSFHWLLSLQEPAE